MILKTIRGKTPSYGENCFFADTSVVVGDVVMGRDCSVRYHAIVVQLSMPPIKNFRQRLEIAFQLGIMQLFTDVQFMTMFLSEWVLLSWMVVWLNPTVSLLLAQ